MIFQWLEFNSYKLSSVFSSYPNFLISKTSTDFIFSTLIFILYYSLSFIFFLTIVSV